MNSKEQILKMLESKIDAMQNLAIEGIELIWQAAYNEAIEEAVKEVKEWDKGCSPKFDIAPELEKLKK